MYQRFLTLFFLFFCFNASSQESFKGFNRNRMLNAGHAGSRRPMQMSQSKSTSIPLSKFSVPTGTCCTEAPLTFNDQSSETPTTWSWSVTPSNAANILSPGSQNVMISFSSAGIFTISLQAGNASGEGQVYTQTISIVASPTISISGNDQIHCEGRVVTLSASGADTYNWSNGGGSSATATYAPVMSGIYIVSGSSNGCTISVPIEVTISDCTGILAQERNMEYAVYPNPCKEMLQITAGNSGNGLAQLRISDISGQVVLVKDLSFVNGKAVLTGIGSLSKGIYFVWLSSGEGSLKVIKVVKE